MQNNKVQAKYYPQRIELEVGHVLTILVSSFPNWINLNTLNHA